jgi:uncharacterized protein YukE
MQFTVATDRLTALAADLDSLSASFDAVAQRRVTYAGYADARHVEQGLHEFFDKWSDGMDKLHKQLSTLATDLHQAVAAYEGTEQQIIDAASGR